MRRKTAGFSASQQTEKERQAYEVALAWIDEVKRQTGDVPQAEMSHDDIYYAAMMRLRCLEMMISAYRHAIGRIASMDATIELLEIKLDAAGLK